VQAEGVIYEQWDVARHLIDPFPIPLSWQRFRAVDFGFTHPFVCQWWAIDGDGRMYLYREIHHTKRTVKVHAEQIKAVERWADKDAEGKSLREPIAMAICDHDAEDRATLAENGIRTMPAQKAVSVGIQRVQERLKVAGDGKPRLFILRGALVETDRDMEALKKPLNTEQEFDGYIWSDNVRREEPVKIDDDGMDALRYAVMYADNPRSGGGIHV
jgi:phage terminase large subunit